MIRRPPRSTRTDTLFPYTTLFRSVLHDFGAMRFGQLSQEAYISGDHEVRQAWLQKINERGRFHRAAVNRHYGKHDILFTYVVVDADRGGFADIWMGEDLRLDLERGDIFAAAPDGIFRSEEHPS